ncbi:hypothetical protein Acor_52050 [Acrocarpospora corrugata]|uniref:Uncharacterized protein n=1 Tax=Acrocarpospora corrugata TaxID=35763 RepID=A0A5M3W4B3_9ACTN|nr:hypothetical protein Acor_52050 [Acrocarpospora corrugata]
MVVQFSAERRPQRDDPLVRTPGAVEHPSARVGVQAEAQRAGAGQPVGQEAREHSPAGKRAGRSGGVDQPGDPEIAGDTVCADAHGQPRRVGRRPVHPAAEHPQPPGGEQAVDPGSGLGWDAMAVHLPVAGQNREESALLVGWQPGPQLRNPGPQAVHHRAPVAPVVADGDADRAQQVPKL